MRFPTKSFTVLPVERKDNVLFHIYGLLSYYRSSWIKVNVCIYSHNEIRVIIAHKGAPYKIQCYKTTDGSATTVPQYILHELYIIPAEMVLRTVIPDTPISPNQTYRSFVGLVDSTN